MMNKIALYDNLASWSPDDLYTVCFLSLVFVSNHCAHIFYLLNGLAYFEQWIL